MIPPPTAMGGGGGGGAGKQSPIGKYKAVKTEIQISNLVRIREYFHIKVRSI